MHAKSGNNNSKILSSVNVLFAAHLLYANALNENATTKIGTVDKRATTVQKHFTHNLTTSTEYEITIFVCIVRMVLITMKVNRVQIVET